MKTKRKSSGFFIVEILIVLVIIAILTLIMLPNLQTYLLRAKFADLERAANSVKPGVENCILNLGKLTGCTGTAGNVYGIPVNVNSNYGGHVTSVATSDGIITVSGVQADFGNVATSYKLTPATADLAPNMRVTWTGTCVPTDLCSN